MDYKNGYPVMTDKAKTWITNLIDGMVSQPDKANVLHIKGGNDLELAIVVAPDDEHIFTPEVCKALKVLVAQVTEVFSPVIYLEAKPHEEAAKSIQAARTEV